MPDEEEDGREEDELEEPDEQAQVENLIVSSAVSSESTPGTFA